MKSEASMSEPDKDGQFKGYGAGKVARLRRLFSDHYQNRKKLPFRECPQDVSPRWAALQDSDAESWSRGSPHRTKRNASQATTARQPAHQTRANLTSPRLLQAANMKHHYPCSPSISSASPTKQNFRNRGMCYNQHASPVSTSRPVQKHHGSLAHVSDHQCLNRKVSGLQNNSSSATKKSSASFHQYRHLSLPSSSLRPEEKRHRNYGRQDDSCSGKDQKCHRPVTDQHTTWGSHPKEMKKVPGPQWTHCSPSPSLSPQKTLADTSHMSVRGDVHDATTERNVSTLHRTYSNQSKPNVKTLPYPAYPYYPYPGVTSPPPKRPGRGKPKSPVCDQEDFWEGQGAGKVDRLRQVFSRCPTNHRKPYPSENAHYFHSHSPPIENPCANSGNGVTESDKYIVTSMLQPRRSSLRCLQSVELKQNTNKVSFTGTQPSPKHDRPHSAKDHDLGHPSVISSARIKPTAARQTIPYYARHSPQKAETTSGQQADRFPSCTPRARYSDWIKQERSGLSHSRAPDDRHDYFQPTRHGSADKASCRDNPRTGLADDTEYDHSCDEACSKSPEGFSKVQKALRKYGNRRIAYKKLPFPKYPSNSTSSPPTSPRETRHFERGQGFSNHSANHNSVFRDCRMPAASGQPSKPDCHGKRATTTRESNPGRKESAHPHPRPAKHGHYLRSEGADGQKLLVSSLCKKFASRGVTLSGRCVPGPPVEASHLAFRKF
ncbi:hypothetical protein ACOMHN_051250 [Nucella lapillus]